jgi:integrase
MVTGLRLEETLRLTRKDFSKGYKDVTVPGLKTASSQATLPLGSYARMLASSQLLDEESGWRAFIDSTYEELRAGWEEVRKHFGWDKDPTATLKALRRTAAYHLHVEQGMPLGLVQQYLRHSNMSTTLGYLKLTGGYGTEEMRRYLK